MNRRKFIHSSTLAGAGLLTKVLQAKQAALPIARDSERSRVVIAQNERVLTAAGRIDAAQISVMLESAVESLFQQKASTVWPALFNSKDTVGLKVNCLAGRGLCTNIELVNVVVESLRSVGIPPHHIIIWDRRDRDLEKAGYHLNADGQGIQCYGNDRAGFSAEVYEFGSAASQLSNTLSKCTAIINLPILKDHGIVGMSGALKNFFGVVNNPNKYHMNIGDPFVADVNMLPGIRQKTRLIICDALVAQYEGGPPFMPEFTWKMNSLIAATDPVAMDRVIWDVLDKKRAEHRLPSLEKAGRKPSYIMTAADAAHRLGTASLDQIDVVNV
jgi:uncharacterized protein (DUF362 family)